MDDIYPLVMISLPLVMAIATMTLRRFPRPQLIAGLVTLFILWVWLWRVPAADWAFPDQIVILFGRGLELTPLVRSLFLLVYPAAALLFGVNWLQGKIRWLVASTLAMLALLAAALMTSNLGQSAVLLLVGAAVLAPVLVERGQQAAPAVWRFLLLMTLAIAALVVAVWYITLGQANLPVARVSFLWALMVLLGGFPFHIWVSGLARRASLGALPLVVGLLPVIIVSFLLLRLDDAPVVRSAPEFLFAVRWGAAAAAALAAFMMVRAHTLRELAAYAVALDMAFLLPAFLAPGVAGKDIALQGLAGRFTGLVLFVAGADRLWDNPNRQGFYHRNGGQMSAILTLFGLLTLIGMPLTPGFPGRWAQLMVVSDVSMGAFPWPAAVLLLALAMAVWAVARAFLGQGETDLSSIGDLDSSLAERIIYTLLLGLGLLLGLFPQIFIGYLSQIARLF